MASLRDVMIGFDWIGGYLSEKTSTLVTTRCLESIRAAIHEGGASRGTMSAMNTYGRQRTTWSTQRTFAMLADNLRLEESAAHGTGRLTWSSPAPVHFNMCVSCFLGLMQKQDVAPQPSAGSTVAKMKRALEEPSGSTGPAHKKRVLASETTSLQSSSDSEQEQRYQTYTRNFREWQQGIQSSLPLTQTCF